MSIPDGSSQMILNKIKTILNSLLQEERNEATTDKLFLGAVALGLLALG